MNLIMLSGGSGKRLWPLSNETRSKQFIRIFKKENDEYESMVQRVYRQARNVDPEVNVTIATSKSQVSTIKNQLGDQVDVCVEPCRRDTFPAIALATLYLRDVKDISENEAVVVCPVDPYVDEDYFETLKELEQLALTDNANLVLMGVEPTYPSEKYGYIIPRDRKDPSCVVAFKEKPSKAVAEEYIRRGALWNGGVFAFKLGYMIRKTAEMTGCENYASLLTKYGVQTKISFDYAVVEKEPSIAVKRFSGRWMDMGTWNTLTDAMASNSIGDVRMNDSCNNVHVINELNVPILCMGLHNMVVSASAEGILVTDKDQCHLIKPFVDDIHQQVMFAEKSWGNFKVLDVENSSLIIKITLLPGHRLQYHSHGHRDETWTVVNGEGIAVIDDAIVQMKPGTMVRLPSGCRHTMIAETEMTVVEVQIGENISAADKNKYSMERIPQATNVSAVQEN